MLSAGARNRRGKPRSAADRQRCDHVTESRSVAGRCEASLTGRSGAGLLGQGVGMISTVSPRAIREPVATDAVATSGERGPELCVIVPTFNERDNVDILIERL